MNNIEKQIQLDEGVVNQLKLSGDNLNVKRVIDYYFYFNSKENREKFLKEVLRIDNYKFKFSHYHDYIEEKDDYPYGLGIYLHNSIDLNYIKNLTVLFTNMAHKYFGKYDGWETKVMNGKE